MSLNDMFVVDKYYLQTGGRCVCNCHLMQVEVGIEGRQITFGNYICTGKSLTKWMART